MYGGGGGSTTTNTYKQDYVELYNASAAPVSIAGWVIEYGSATGNWGSSSGNYFVIPAGAVIEPCGYMLFGCGTVGTGGADFPVAADYSQSTGPNISATNGKVALFSALNANLACGAELAGTLVDKVSFGTGNCPEGTNVAVLSGSTGAVRTIAGIDTDSNVADFSVVSNPVPHNKLSSTGCPVPAESQSWGALKSTFR